MPRGHPPGCLRCFWWCRFDEAGPLDTRRSHVRLFNSHVSRVQTPAHFYFFNITIWSGWERMRGHTFGQPRALCRDTPQFFCTFDTPPFLGSPLPRLRPPVLRTSFNAQPQCRLMTTRSFMAPAPWLSCSRPQLDFPQSTPVPRPWHYHLRTESCGGSKSGRIPRCRL